MLAEPIISTAALSTRIGKQLQRGRTTGKYQLSTLDLAQVPEELYNGKALDSIKFWEEVPTQSINLSHNHLQEIPHQLSQMADLKLLDISNNRLTSLACQVFADLLVLDISNNSLVQLPDISSSFPSLQRLALGSNPMKALTLGALSHLVELAADGCQLDCMPSGIQASSQLTKLNLSCNRLSCFPSLEGLTQLVELDLSRNSMMGAVSDTVASSCSLQSLDVSQNKLTTMPATMSQLSQLTELRLGFNDFRKLPEEIAALPALRVLDFRDNHIASLSASFARMALTFLDARNNALQLIPPELGRLTTLRYLGVQGNPIKGIRPTMLSAPTAELLNYLGSKIEEGGSGTDGVQGSQGIPRVVNGALSLAGRKLDAIPSEVLGLEGQLHSLDLRGCSLQGQQGHLLESLPGLNALVLANNYITEWPFCSSKGSALQLRKLDLSHNPLKCIPIDGLDFCSKSLTRLNLRGVRAIGKSNCRYLVPLENLQHLSLKSCNLAKIPSAIFQLKALTTLDLSSNAIEEVPEQLTELSALSEMDISNNSVTKLPPVLGLMHPTLRILQVEGNPIRSIRQAILQRGTPTLLQYLRDKLPPS